MEKLGQEKKVSIEEGRATQSGEFLGQQHDDNWGIKNIFGVMSVS